MLDPNIMFTNCCYL